jgi:MFS family permease
MTLFTLIIFAGQGAGAMCFSYIDATLGWRWCFWINLISELGQNYFACLTRGQSTAHVWQASTSFSPKQEGPLSWKLEQYDSPKRRVELILQTPPWSRLCHSGPSFDGR